MASRCLSESFPYLTPQDHVFTSRFHYKIKRKGGEFDKCKVRLVVQGQHMRRKGEDGVGDYDDAFSPVLATSGFRTILSLATQPNMFTDHVDVSQAFMFLRPKVNYCPVTMARFTFLHRQDMPKILSTRIAHLTTLRHALYSQSLAHHHECFPGKRKMCHGGI